MFGRRENRANGWRGRENGEDGRFGPYLVRGMAGRTDGEEGSSIRPSPPLPFSIRPNMGEFGGMDANPAILTPFKTKIPPNN